MKFSTQALLKAGLALALAAAAGLAAAQTSFTATYKGGTGSCGTTYNITGKEPSGSGPYPLFIYIGGTGENYTSLWGGASLDAAVALDREITTLQDNYAQLMQNMRRRA